MKFFKSLSFVLVLTFFLGTIAPASAHPGLADAINKYNYAMNVEWDQEDMAFKEQAEMRLNKTIGDLVKSGLTAKELQSYLAGQIADDKTRADFNRLVAGMKAQNFTEDEAAAMAASFAQKTQASGTNFIFTKPWMCNKWCKVVVVVVVVIVIRHVWKAADAYDHTHHH